MAIYHLTVNISNCACDSMAYGLRTKIVDNLTNEIHDRRGKGLKTWGIELCQNAPEEWKVPQKLCDAIVESEKHKDAQQCRTFEGSLPSDEGITDEDRERIVRQFACGLKKQGMCVVWSIHKPDEGNRNWHFHAYATMRSVDEHGHFMAKCKKVYEMKPVMDYQGNPIFDDEGKPVMEKIGIYDKKGNIKTDKAGRKQYKSKREDTNDWNKIETLQMWRKGYELIQNQLFKRKGIEAHVSCETLKEQGLDRIPQIHIPRKSWELMQVGGNDPWVERYKQIKEMNEAKAKEQAITDEIASLEAEIKEIDKNIEEKAQAFISTPVVEILSEEMPETLDVFVKTSEKEPAENAQISHDLKPDGYVSPPVEEKMPEPEQTEEKLNDYTVLHIHDIVNKITGYLSRTFEIFEKAVKAKELPDDRSEQKEDEERLTTDIYKYYESRGEATEALYKFEDEAAAYNAEIDKKQAQQEESNQKATAQKAVSGIKEFAGSVAARIKEYRKKKAEEKAYREWYEANKDIDEHGYYVEFWQNPKTRERAVWISGEEKKKVVDEPSQVVTQGRNLLKGEDGMLHMKKYFRSLQEAEKFVKQQKEKEYLEANNLKIIDPPKDKPRLIYPVDIRQERKALSYYGYNACDIPQEQDFEVCAGKPEIVDRAYRGLEPSADEKHRFLQIYKLNKEDCAQVVEEYKNDPEKCRQEFKDHPFVMTEYEENCYYKRHKKDYNKVITPLENAGIILGRITICKDESTGKLFGVKELNGSVRIKDYLLPDKVFATLTQDLDEKTIAAGKWIDVKKIHVDKDTKTVTIDYDIRGTRLEKEMELKPEIVKRERKRVAREKAIKAQKEKESNGVYWHR